MINSPAQTDTSTVEHHTFSGVVLITLLYLRLMGAVMDSFGAGVGSRATTLCILAFIVLHFANAPTWRRSSGLWLFGWSIVCAASVGSIVMNDLSSTFSAWSFVIQVSLYALFLPVVVNIIQTNPRYMMEQLAGFTKAFLIVGFLLSVYQIGSGNAFVSVTEAAVRRAYGTAAHPVSYGLQVICALVLLELIRLRLKLPFSKMVFLVALISLYLTQSRTAWVFGGLLFIIYGGRRIQGMGRVLYYVAIAVILGVAATASDRFSDLSSLPTFLAQTDFSSDTYDFRYVDNSVAWRISSWVLSLKLAAQAPFLGFGPGQAAEVSYFGLSMHNIFLEFQIQTGLIGLLGFIILLGGNVSMMRVLAKKTLERSLVQAYLFLLLVSASFGASLIYQTMTVFFYILILAVSATRLDEAIGD